MYRPRIIPCLLLEGRRLVKTKRFCGAEYVGDPINAVKIFNEKEVDELIVLDINASKSGAAPDFHYIESLATECFMPVCYGGGVRSVADAERIIACGVEKVSVNAAALNRLELVSEIAMRYGSQSVTVGIDVKQDWLRRVRVWNSALRRPIALAPANWARRAADAGAGEILLNAVDRDGTLMGYDLNLIKSISDAVTVPVIACGGASSLENCKAAISAGGASAAAAGALFVYQGPHRAVLINYPTPNQLKGLFQ
ncbi:MAG: imidazole glycerol phosphate synthase subunit HisF [Candidatus Accumulibacter meliphilus]|jgi:cyclase|uniref:imidazole glycerol-phosphate synthase n=1 Tax=Candidatus Accumulibacter meliphilus TaxID=2211374 RepID=A0A369XUX3_9PROT|nr:MAG: imidazole glycerol phosphate synthase subunit HisF [Candidatus Accumulibacter meliphilus]